MRNSLQIIGSAFIFLLIGQNSNAQVAITLDSDPFTQVNGTTVIIFENHPDSTEVNAKMSLTNEFANNRDFTIRIVRRISDDNIDQFCSDVCVEKNEFNSVNENEWVFPMSISLAPGGVGEFKPGYKILDNNFCAINDYYVENQFGIKVDSVRVKFVVGLSECFLSTKELSPVKEFKIFPNPSAGQVTIKDAQEGSTFEVYDMLGKVTYKGSVNSASQVVDLSSLTDGVYFYAIRQKNGQLLPTRKLVIRK